MLDIERHLRAMAQRERGRGVPMEEYGAFKAQADELAGALVDYAQAARRVALFHLHLMNYARNPGASWRPEHAEALETLLEAGDTLRRVVAECGATRG